MLARSDRVYRDILQHTLFNRGGDFADADEAAARTAAERSFALNVHVSEFFDGFDPAFEFRGFVCGGRQACLTAYSPWIYSPAMVRERDAILASIQRVWTAASQRLPAHLRDYSIDFAVSPHDVSLCWVVEVNATLPPLAGSGLFDVHDARDAALLRGEGEFEFRLLERALTDADFLTERTDVKTGRVTRTQMLPAPVHVMRALDAARCQKFGVPYKAAVAAEAVAKSGSSDTDASAETICAIM